MGIRIKEEMEQALPESIMSLLKFTLTKVLHKQEKERELARDKARQALREK